MGLSEAKKKIVIDNYFKAECNINTTIKEAFTRGFELGLKKAPAPQQGEWIIVKDEKWGDNVKCPFCGKELAGTDLNFCCKCGAKLIGSEKMNGGAENLDYRRAIEDTEYCEGHEPTYNSDDGSM